MVFFNRTTKEISAKIVYYGPGLGGKTTAIGVNVEVAHRHPASYPVAILFNCYVARRAKIRMYPNGEWLFC